MLRDEPGSFLQYWIEEHHPVFDEAVLPASPTLHEFRTRMDQLLDTDPAVIHANQLDQVTGADSLNVSLVLGRRAGVVREMSCLEGVLLAALTDRSAGQGRSMYTHPVEFLSYVLARNDSLKIYFYTVDQPGIRGLGIFNDLLDRDKEEGWVVLKNIHNHNFFPGSAMVLGGLAPGTADVMALRSATRYYGFTHAVITNGFHSIDLNSDDLENLSDGSD